MTLALLLAPGLAGAAQAINFGVLAEPSPDAVAARYQPLMDYLSASLGGTPVRLQALGADELAEAVAHNRLELVLTTPAQYVALRTMNSLTGALATLARQQNGHITRSIGGVVVVADRRDELQRLADLRGRRIGVPMLAALGGFQAPALELRAAGVDIRPAGAATTGSTAKTPSRVELNVLGSDQAIVQAVLAGTIDAGFLRTGSIEALAHAGTLDPSRLRVLNRQRLGNFPWAASTRLYPDWPLAALPTLDADQTRRVTAALLALEPDHPAARAAGLAGFGPPADYSSVEELARTLRLPPYDAAPTLTWHDFWAQYRTVVVTSALGVAVLAGLLVLLAARTRRLAQGTAALSQALASQQAILSATPYPVFEVDAEGLILGTWASSAGTTTIEPEKLVGRRVAEALPEAAAEIVMRALREAGQHGRAQSDEFALPTVEGERWFTLSAGLIRDSARPQRFAVLVRHITDERESKRWLDIAASVFTHAGEGVLISGPDSRILAANQAFARILGYPDDRTLIGRYTNELRLDYLGGESFDTLRQRLKRNGTWQGEIRGRRESGEPWSATLNVNVARDAAGHVTHHVAILTDITQLKAQQQQLEHIAQHDPLTGLPNRTLLADRLQQAMAHARRHDERLAVVYLDLDGFKAVNDVQGHGQGDALLVALARRMSGVLRQTDTLARIGGDEFVAVLTDLTADQDAQPWLERLLQAANEPVHLAAGEARVSASLGVTFYPQAEPVDADQLLRQADHALYQAKLGGKNRHHVYDPVHAVAARSRHEAVQEIRSALHEGQFVLHYQPKVNLKTGQLIGAEALIRWQHPQRGLLAPGLFLPAIENHPLAIELGEWVIDSALDQLEQWRQAGLDLSVSVNVSAYQLQQPDFLARLSAALQARPTVERGALEIEVLETSALADLEHIAGLIRACAGIGVSFALDDFGTGYSSLLYLKHLPANTLKIDQSFVRQLLDDADNLAILEGILTLAHNFGRTTIAEGVETVEQGTLLLQLGCEMGQGYGIARPMPAAELPGWMATWQVPDAWHGAARMARDRLPLLMGDIEHRAWIRGIEDWLHGRRTAPLAVDADAGRFGTWLHEQGRRLYGSTPAFRAIDTLHRQMHDLADDLAGWHAAGRTHEALERLPELWGLLERMRGQYGGLFTSPDPGDDALDVHPGRAAAGAFAGPL